MWVWFYYLFGFFFSRHVCKRWILEDAWNTFFRLLKQILSLLNAIIMWCAYNGHVDKEPIFLNKRLNKILFHEMKIIWCAWFSIPIQHLNETSQQKQQQQQQQWFPQTILQPLSSFLASRYYSSNLVSRFSIWIMRIYSITGWTRDINVMSLV